MASENDSKKKKKKKRRGSETASRHTDDSGEGFPEDAEGGLYGDRRTAGASAHPESNRNAVQDDENLFKHEF